MYTQLPDGSVLHIDIRPLPPALVNNLSALYQQPKQLISLNLKVWCEENFNEIGVNALLPRGQTRND